MGTKSVNAVISVYNNEIIISSEMRQKLSQLINVAVGWEYFLLCYLIIKSFFILFSYIVFWQVVKNRIEK